MLGDYDHRLDARPGSRKPLLVCLVDARNSVDRPLYQQVCYELRKMPEINRLGLLIARFVVSAQTIRRIKIEILTGLAQAIYLQISPFVSRN
jgi:hypothetical protein